jgi:transient receptor potential cation channel subfamily C member 4
MEQVNSALTIEPEALTTFPQFTVAGKKGKMMERRILKDFQIGIVEGLINETLQSAKEPKDVFSTLAKVIGKRSSSKV